MKSLLFTETSIIDDALRLLDENGNGFLPVVDDQNKLLGIITDGDIRRGILNKSLELNSIINKNPITAKIGTSHLSIKKYLKEIHRRHMPVVDENGKLIEVVILDEFEFVSKQNWVVIMAGGLGTRLGELTKNTPKPMLNVGGKSILQGIIEHFKSQGFCKFVLCLNYKAEIIEDYFKNGDWLGVEIKYTKEKERLGTAGALSLINFGIDSPFFVVNGDLITTINFDSFLEYHNKTNSFATMCIKGHHFQIPYACINFNEESDIVEIKEKPNQEFFINTGMYILDPNVLKEINKNEYFDMPHLFEKLMRKSYKCKVYRTDDYWLDLGRPEDLDKGQADLTL